MDQQVVTPQEPSSSTLLGNDFADITTTAPEMLHTFDDEWTFPKSYAYETEHSLANKYGMPTSSKAYPMPDMHTPTISYAMANADRDAAHEMDQYINHSSLDVDIAPSGMGIFDPSPERHVFEYNLPSASSTPAGPTPTPTRGKKRQLEGLGVGESPMGGMRIKRHATMSYINGTTSATSSPRPTARSRETSTNRRLATGPTPPMPNRSVSYGNALYAPCPVPWNRNVSNMSGVTAFSDDLQTPMYSQPPLPMSMSDPPSLNLYDSSMLQPAAPLSDYSYMSGHMQLPATATVSPSDLTCQVSPTTYFDPSAPAYPLDPSFNSFNGSLLAAYPTGPLAAPSQLGTIAEGNDSPAVDPYFPTPGLSYTAASTFTGHIPAHGYVPTPTVPAAPYFTSPHVGFGSNRPAMPRPTPLNTAAPTQYLMPGGMQRATSFGHDGQVNYTGGLAPGPLTAPPRSSFSSTQPPMHGGLFPEGVAHSAQMDRTYKSLPVPNSNGEFSNGGLTHVGGPIMYQPSQPHSRLTSNTDSSGRTREPSNQSGAPFGYNPLPMPPLQMQMGLSIPEQVEEEVKEKRARMPTYLKPGPKAKTPQKNRKASQSAATNGDSTTAGPSTPTPVGNSGNVPSVLAPVADTDMLSPIASTSTNSGVIVPLQTVSVPGDRGQFTSNQPTSRDDHATNEDVIQFKMLPPDANEAPIADPTRIEQKELERFFKELKEEERELRPNGCKNPVDIKKKQFKCLIGECGQILARRSAAIAHIQTHMDDKPFKCRFEDCGTKFVRKHDLTRHEKIHANAKEHVCACNKQFTRQDALNRHMMRNICAGGKPDETKDKLAPPPVPTLPPHLMAQNRLHMMGHRPPPPPLAYMAATGAYPVPYAPLPLGSAPGPAAYAPPIPIAYPTVPPAPMPNMTQSGPSWSMPPAAPYNPVPAPPPAAPYDPVPAPSSGGIIVPQ